MIAQLPVAKFILPPVTAGVIFAADLWTDLGGSIGVALNIAAIGILIGGFVVVGALRSSLVQKNEIIADLKTERDIEKDKANRFAQDLADLRVLYEHQGGDLKGAEARIVQLEQRPDMSVLLDELRSGRETAVVEVGARIDALAGLIQQALQSEGAP